MLICTDGEKHKGDAPAKVPSRPQKRAPGYREVPIHYTQGFGVDAVEVRRTLLVGKLEFKPRR